MWNTRALAVRLGMMSLVGLGSFLGLASCSDDTTDDKDEEVGYQVIYGVGKLDFHITHGVIAHGLEASRRQSHSMKAATSGYSLSNGTPVLPFLGNAFTFGYNTDGTNTAFDLLMRQSDCSLTEVVFSQDRPPATTLLAALPGAQDYLHQLAGLTSKPDVFAKGCHDVLLGVPARVTEFVGQAKNGNFLIADAANDLVITQITAAGLFVSQTTLASNVGGLLAVADIDGDGFNDIVATGVAGPGGGAAGLGVFLSNGDGTFKAPIVSAYPGYFQFTVDDVDGDGHPDVVLSSFDFNTSTSSITTLLGKGDGTFTASSTVATVGVAGGNFDTTSPLVTGDFDGDGRKDIVAGNDFLHGSGNGTFTLTTSALPFASYASLAVGDFNGDGKLDVAGIPGPGNGGAVRIFLGNGAGSFTAGEAYAAIPGLHLMATDIDGDGVTDLVVGLGGNGVYSNDAATDGFFQVLMGRGDATFVGAPLATAATEISGSFHVAPALADFTGDDVVDLVTPVGADLHSTLSKGISVLPGAGNGQFGTAIVTTTNLVPYAIADVDFNKDGKRDALLGGADGFAVLPGNGDGTFGAEQDYALPLNGSVVVGIASGDFNGDGILDVASAVSIDFGQGTPGVYVSLGMPQGGFAAPVLVDGAQRPKIAVADFNGDGRSDLVVVDQGHPANNQGPQVAGALHVYMGNADGTLAPVSLTAVTPAGAATLYFSDVTVGDLNKDGVLDIVAVGYDGSFNGTLLVVMGSGNGGFAPGVQSALPVADEEPATVVKIADIDKDGNMDVAFLVQNRVGIAFGDGSGLPANVSYFGIGNASPAGLIAADLNADGYVDLLVGTPTGEAALLNQYAQAVLPPATAATNTTLTSSAASLGVGQSVTLTATVAASTGSSVPTGTVSFMDGTTTLGSATLSAGTATYTTTALAAGSHALTASYAGDGSFTASISPVLSIQVTAAADFALSVAPASGSIAAGQSAQSVVTLTPSNGFAQSITLSCSGLPVGATCNFSPASVTPAGSAGSSTLSIATTGTVSASAMAPPTGMPGGLLLAGISLPLLVSRRRYRQLALLSLGAIILLQGCHDDHHHPGSSTGATPAGTYIVTVVGTAGSTSHSASFTLTIT